MPDTDFNKYRAAIEVLQRGRDLLVDQIADEIVDQADELIAGSYLFNELLESQGTKLHFLCLLVAQLEQSAEGLDEARAAAAPPPPTKTAKPRPRGRSRSGKKSGREAVKERSPDDA